MDFFRETTFWPLAAWVLPPQNFTHTTNWPRLASAHPKWAGRPLMDPNGHPNGLFSGDYISVLRGCCALKFLHTLESDQGLLAHTRRGTGVPLQKKHRENLKLALKFSVLESIAYGIMEVFSLNFFMRPAITARGISSSWNWFCTRTCGAGRPHVWLCHARLVMF